jgi:ubiquinone/menaquinone biosynthesis C-methylase UbiE
MDSSPNKADVQDFNRRAASYEDATRQSYLFDKVQRMVLNFAKTQSCPKTVLDVGCGTGRLLRKAKGLWPDARFVGVDAAEKMIEEATRLFPEGEFHAAMAESLPLSDASIDLVFSTLSFHHWVDQTKGVGEIARVLRPEGRFLLADIVLPFGLGLFSRHFERNNSKRMRETFVAAGLKVEFQKRPWSWSRFLVVTAGVKPLG